MKQSRQENLMYLAAWGLLFAAPVLSLYVRSANDAGVVFDWTDVFAVWRMFAAFLLLFLVHNFLLAPLLVYERKHVAYCAAVAVVLAASAVVQCQNAPHDREPLKHRQPLHGEMFEPRQPDFDDRRPDGPRPDGFRHDTPPPFVGERDILSAVVLLLVFGANLGTKFYFRSSDDRKRLASLEKQNLEQQLEYLRYQINPHFFMNTLNNIHALVDIDPAKAQETIVELSKMMRFVLYEGDKHGVPLTRELDFIRTYINLMQLRYTDKVKITLCLPAEVPDKTIAPLVLIAFVENAFKHGISYEHDSFIEVKASVGGDRLLFSCRNSKADHPNQEKGGVGLANVRKRLNLLYGHGYALRIKDDAVVYSVELDIPLEPIKNK